MALRGTLTHRKTRRLAKALGVPLPFALGVLEALWHVAGEQAKDGGIGRMTDEDIADETFWEGDPAALVAALVSAGWLDERPDCRLYVHDWHDHSDDATDVSLARSGTLYANGAMPRMRRLSEDDRAKVCARNGWSGEPVAKGAHNVPHKATPCAQKATTRHKKPLPVPESGSGSGSGVSNVTLPKETATQAAASGPPGAPVVPELVSGPPNPGVGTVLNPYQEVEAVMKGVAARLDTPEPLDTEIRRYLGKASAVRQLAAKYGIPGAVEVAVYAMTHSPNCGWARVWEANASFSSQMRKGVEPAFKNGRTGTTVGQKLAALGGSQ